MNWIIVGSDVASPTKIAEVRGRIVIRVNRVRIVNFSFSIDSWKENSL